MSKIVAGIRKKHGRNAAITLKDERSESHIHEYLPTGIDVVDHYLLSGGGLPVGRMSEIFGLEGCGKTSLAYSAMAAVQKLGGVAEYIDSETSFDEDRARVFGVDTDTVIIAQPETLEDALNITRTSLAAHDPDDGPLLIVWDSVASSVTKASMEASAGNERVGGVPLLLSRELPKLLKALQRSRAHFMMINQIRSKIGVMFGPNTTTPGGHAPKFYSSQRIEFFGGKAQKNAKGEHVAKVVTLVTQKNRMAPPYRKARVRFDYTHGYDNMWTTIEHAKRMKLIQPREDGFSGKGKAGRAAYLEASKRCGWNPSECRELPTYAGPAADSDDDDDSDE